MTSESIEAKIISSAWSFPRLSTVPIATHPILDIVSDNTHKCLMSQLERSHSIYHQSTHDGQVPTLPHHPLSVHIAKNVDSCTYSELIVTATHNANHLPPMVMNCSFHYYYFSFCDGTNWPVAAWAISNYRATVCQQVRRGLLSCLVWKVFVKGVWTGGGACRQPHRSLFCGQTSMYEIVVMEENACEKNY